MITLPDNVQVVKASGSGAMNGVLDATALSSITVYEKPHARVTSASHGIVAGSQLFFSAIVGTSYTTNAMRHITAVASNTMDVKVPEGYTAGTPSGSEVWCAGFVSSYPYYFIGFKLHLNAAEAVGETLTLATDAYAGAAWDEVIKSVQMIGVTDIVYFPEVPIPLEAGDVLKFAWANTGAKTWGVKLFVAPMV